MPGISQGCKNTKLNKLPLLKLKGKDTREIKDKMRFVPGAKRTQEGVAFIQTRKSGFLGDWF